MWAGCISRDNGVHKLQRSGGREDTCDRWSTMAVVAMSDILCSLVNIYM